MSIRARMKRRPHPFVLAPLLVALPAADCGRISDPEVVDEFAGPMRTERLGSDTIIERQLRIVVEADGRFFGLVEVSGHHSARCMAMGAVALECEPPEVSSSFGGGVVGFMVPGESSDISVDNFNDPGASFVMPCRLLIASLLEDGEVDCLSWATRLEIRHRPDVNVDARVEIAP